MMLRAISLILFIAATAGATTIVAVRDRKEIVIAADSKVTDTFGNATGGVACKIVPVGKMVFAHAGFSRDTRTGLSVPDLVEKELLRNPGESVTEAADLAAAAVADRLGRELLLLKQNDPATFRIKIEGRTFLRLLFAGFDKKTPVIAVRRFRFGPLPAGGTGILVTSDDCAAGCRGKIETRFLGETEAIDGLPEETRGFWKAGLAAGARKLVETEIAARNDYVGPPVDIVSIKPKGIAWIAKKPECGQ
jgi:hypothetical protein